MLSFYNNDIAGGKFNLNSKRILVLFLLMFAWLIAVNVFWLG